MSDTRFKLNPEERDHIVSWIEEHYFQHNFGETSKTDFETFLFAQYLSHLERDEKASTDDLTIGKELGLTNTKVRNLKERRDLKYPRPDFDWKRKFAQSVVHANLSDDHKTIRVLIEDVTVLKELRAFLEKHHMFDEHTLNQKLFVCNAVFFVDICEKLSSENDIFKITPDIEKQLEEIKNTDKNFIELIHMKNYKAAWKYMLKNQMTPALSAAAGAIPGGNAAAIILKAVASAVIEHSDKNP